MIIGNDGCCQDNRVCCGVDQRVEIDGGLVTSSDSRVVGVSPKPCTARRHEVL